MPSRSRASSYSGLAVPWSPAAKKASRTPHDGWLRSSPTSPRTGGAAVRGAYALWMMQLPMRAAYKLNLMGGWYSAEQAVAWQCVQRVVPLGRLEPETRRWARNCARIRTAGYAETKRKLHKFYEHFGTLGDSMAPMGALREHAYGDVLLPRGPACRPGR